MYYFITLTKSHRERVMTVCSLFVPSLWGEDICKALEEENILASPSILSHSIKNNWACVDTSSTHQRSCLMGVVQFYRMAWSGHQSGHEAHYSYCLV